MASSTSLTSAYPVLDVDDSKKVGLGHAKTRPAHLIPEEFGDQIDWDFKGPLPVSFFNRRWILS